MLSMISDLFYKIYTSPLARISCIMLLMVFFWITLVGIIFMCSRLLSYPDFVKIFSFLCLIGSAVMVFVIFYMTVFSRSRGVREIVLVPFYSFHEASRQPEYYRQMLMNVFLFEPLGLVIPFGLSWIHGRKNQINESIMDRNNNLIVVKHSVILCLCFSLLIELNQGIFGLGRAETDDVIMNITGSLVGIACYLFIGRRAVQYVKE